MTRIPPGPSPAQLYSEQATQEQQALNTFIFKGGYARIEAAGDDALAAQEGEAGGEHTHQVSPKVARNRKHVAHGTDDASEEAAAHHTAKA